MIENLVLLLLAAIPLMGSPGPATLSLAAAGSVFGVRKSLWYLAGIILGTSTVLLLIATGLVGVLFAMPAVVPVLTSAALVYILYLAYKIATAPVLSGEQADSKPPSLIGGVLLAVANPKAFAAIGAVYASVHLVAGRPLLDAAFKIAALVGVIIAVNTAWLLFGASMARALRNPKTGKWMNRAFAIALVAAVGVTVLL